LTGSIYDVKNASVHLVYPVKSKLSKSLSFLTLFCNVLYVKVLLLVFAVPFLLVISHLK